MWVSTSWLFPFPSFCQLTFPSAIRTHLPLLLTSLQSLWFTCFVCSPHTCTFESSHKSRSPLRIRSVYPCFADPTPSFLPPRNEIVSHAVVGSSLSLPLILLSLLCPTPLSIILCLPPSPRLVACRSYAKKGPNVNCTHSTPFGLRCADPADFFACSSAFGNGFLSVCLFPSVGRFPTIFLSRISSDRPEQSIFLYSVTTFGLHSSSSSPNEVS
ncbi:hypothetical protein B0T10DRAFT_271458 [Thelonectria olida]|uniref:Uncharacterized protein n=1 Tax=Thelonectria olida TaxID=1576542 RepID=A0A9P8W8V6_9HYPO|nr:hypothetical protein B0T10DRAFT_271458 [Thelonectria olida]